MHIHAGRGKPSLATHRRPGEPSVATTAVGVCSEGWFSAACVDVRESTVLGALSVNVAEELRVDIMKQQLLLVWGRSRGSRGFRERVREGVGVGVTHRRRLNFN